jgi:hypothetical protein
MPDLTALPNIKLLTKNNHLILNLAGLEYPGMYDTFNILYLGYLPSDPPLFLHIPYLTILSDEQVRRQPSGAARQIILFNDQLKNNNYVSDKVNSQYFQSFYSEVIKKYKINIQKVLLESKGQANRQIIFNMIDSLFVNANFLIKLYLLIYNMTASIPQAPLGAKENNIDAIVEILNQRLNNIFIKIDFSKLGSFVLPRIQLDYPPEPLPPPLTNFAELASTYPDIDLEVLKLLCQYRMPVATTTPDIYLSLLISPVY